LSNLGLQDLAVHLAHTAWKAKLESSLVLSFWCMRPHCTLPTWCNPSAWSPNSHF